MNSTIQQQLYDLVATDEIEKAFEILENAIQVEAPLLIVDLTLLRRRYQEIVKDDRAGTISNDELRTEQTKLARDLIYLIQQLPTEDELKIPAATSATSARGKLLHDIPGRFPLQKMTKCVIRIADTEQALLADYQTGPDTVIEDDVPIEKVMAVELIDIEEGKNFEIKALNSSAQQLLSGEATQWVYYVKALQAGNHLLVLRVSTVEVIDGVERPKEVLFERNVLVETEATPKERDTERVWQPTNLSLGAKASPPVTLPPQLEYAAPSDMASEVLVKPPISTTLVQPSPIPPKHSTQSGTPWTKIAAAALLLVVAGWWGINSTGDSNGDLVATVEPPIEVEPVNPRTEPEKDYSDLDSYFENGNDRTSYSGSGEVAAVAVGFDYLLGTYRSNTGKQVEVMSGSDYQLLIVFAENNKRVALEQVDELKFKSKVESIFYNFKHDDHRITGFTMSDKPDEVWAKEY